MNIIGKNKKRKDKKGKAKKSPTKILVGDMVGVFPRGWEQVWIVRFPKKGGAK